MPADSGCMTQEAPLTGSSYAEGHDSYTPSSHTQTYSSHTSSHYDSSSGPTQASYVKPPSGQLAPLTACLV